MEEPLVIIRSIFQANEILKVIKDPDQLYWEWGPHQLNAAAKWLPKRGFKILPKTFDTNYRPGSVGDEGERIVTKAKMRNLQEIIAEDVHVLMWNALVLRLPEMKREIKRISDGDVLDMSFEEEVVKDIESVSEKGKDNYVLNPNSVAFARTPGLGPEAQRERYDHSS
jgi:hypothetical protein